MAAPVGKEQPSQILKACEGINVHSKFKSAYYFSLQPLEILCDPATGRCSQNARYALEHGSVPKILVGLQQYPDDEQVSLACMKIFEVMCEAAEREQLQFFCDEGGLQGVLNWTASADAKKSVAAFGKALNILVSLADYNVTAAIPTLINKLKTQTDLGIAQDMCEALIKIADAYQGTDLEGLSGLIGYLLLISERSDTSKDFKRLVQTVFKALRAVAVKSADPGLYILELLELKDRYEDESFTQEYLLPLLRSLCTREVAANAISVIVNAKNLQSGTTIGKLVYQVAYCSEMADVVSEMQAHASLVAVLAEGVKAVQNTAQTISEELSHLIRGSCLCLSNLASDPDQMEKVERAGAFDVAVSLAKGAARYPQIAGAAYHVIAPLLKNEANALKFVQGGTLKIALERLSASGEAESSKTLLGVAHVIADLSKHHSCCEYFKEQKVVPQLMKAIRESTYNSAIAFLLASLRSYVSRCTAANIDQQNVLLFVDRCIEQHHMTEHIITETARLIQALAEASKGAFDATLSSRLIFKCLDSVPSVEDECFADCVGALRSIPDVESWIDQNANACSEALSKLSTRSAEAIHSLTRLGALCSVDIGFAQHPSVKSLVATLPSSVNTMLRNEKISPATRERLTLTMVYLLQATTDPMSSLNILFEIVDKIDNARDADALVAILSHIRDRVSRFQPKEGDSSGPLPTTANLSHLLNTSVIDSLVLSTQAVLNRHGDSRPGSVAALQLLDEVIALNNPEGSTIALGHKVQTDVINIGKRLKIWAEVQLAVFSTLEKLLKFGTEDQLKFTRELGLIQAIKSAEANHARNKPLRAQIFRVSVLVMQSNYLDEIIKTLIQQCDADLTAAVSKTRDRFSDVGDGFEQLLMPLAEADGVRIALRYKLVPILDRCLIALQGPDTKYAAQVMIPAMSKLLVQITRNNSAQNAMLELAFPTKITAAAASAIAANASQSSIISLLLSTAGQLINYNVDEAEKCLSYSENVMHWLEVNDFAQICYEAITAWMSKMPTSALIDSADFKEIVKHLVKATASEDLAIVASALRALRQWDQPELLSILRDMGVERACYQAVNTSGTRSSFVINEGVAVLERFSVELAQELPQKETLSRARVLARALASASSEITLIRAFDILGRLVTYCPEKTWFRGETSLIKSVRWSQVKLSNRISEIEDSMNAILSVMGGEEMALMLMSQLLDDMNLVGSTVKLEQQFLARLGSDFADIAAYLTGIPERPQRLFQGVADCLAAVQPILDAHPAHLGIRDGVYQLTTRALDFALLLKTDDGTLAAMGQSIMTHLGEDLVRVLNTGMDSLSGLKLMARLCACQTTSEWAMGVLKQGGLINECFRLLKTQSSASEVRKALEFMTALGMHIEGFHMLQRSFKTLYGSNADYWQQQSKAASDSICIDEMLRHLHNFPGNSDGCAEAVMNDPGALATLAASSPVAAAWTLAICTKAANFVSAECLAAKSPLLITYSAKVFAEFEQVFVVRSITPQEMCDVLEPLAKIISYTSRMSSLDAINGQAVDALTHVLRVVDMRSQLWKIVLPSLIESVSDSKFCAERVVRCIYPVIQDQLRFFKGAHSVIRDEGLRLIAACSLYIPIPDHQDFLKALGKSSDSDLRAQMKPLDLARSDLLRERNTGVIMNTESSEIVRKHLPLLIATLTAVATIPLNPNDAKAGDLFTALECIALVRSETRESFSPIFQSMLLKQTNPVILSAVIRTLGELQVHSPKSVPAVFAGGADTSHVVSELVKGLESVSSDERIERLVLFTQPDLPASLLLQTQLIDICARLFHQTEIVRERRFLLIALRSMFASPDVPPKSEYESQLVPVLLSGLADQRVSVEAIKLYDACLAKLPNIEALLQKEDAWQALAYSENIVPLLIRSAVSREGLLSGDCAQLKRWIEALPQTADILNELCERDARFVAKIQELIPPPAEAFILSKSQTLKEAGGLLEGSLLLLLIHFGSAERGPHLEQAFKAVAAGEGDAPTLQACCRSLNSSARGGQLVKALSVGKWVKHRDEILKALLDSPAVTEALKNEGVERCKRDPRCLSIILDRSGQALSPDVLCEMLSTSPSPAACEAIFNRLRSVDWTTMTVAPHLVRLLENNSDVTTAETLLRDLREQLERNAGDAAQFDSAKVLNAEWEDEPVPSEGFLPLSYAIPRPIGKRAWQLLDLSASTCFSLATGIIRLIGARPSIDAVAVDLLAYLACEKPVGLEEVWFSSNFFAKATKLLQARPVTEDAVNGIATIACNVAAVSDEQEFHQLRNMNEFWLALEESGSVVKNKSHEAHLYAVLRAVHDNMATQLTFLKLSSFNWFVGRRQRA